jgi:hypothetical protein
MVLKYAWFIHYINNTLLELGMLLFKQPAIILMTLLLIFVGKAYASDVIINASQTCEAKVINNDYLHT